MSLASFVAAVLGALREANIPCMLTGSLAAAYYGSLRATQDVDLVIEPSAENLEQLVTELESAGFYVDRQVARDAFKTGGQFNAVDPASGWKADFIFRKARPFSEAEFSRRAPKEIAGIAVALPTLEDLIIAKLEWSELGDSELQRRDIRQLIEMAGGSLDNQYLSEWIGQLGLENAWERING